MIRKQREQLARLFAGSDLLAIAIGFLATFWLRFYSGLLRVPKGIPRFSSYLIIVPFLLAIHLVYFSYQGFYRFKLRRNRLDDLFSVILNSAASTFTVLLVFSYLKSYGFIRFGSRVDVYLPPSARPRVAVGDKVRATETIIAELD